MKTYTCSCGELVFFENIACVTCKKELGFLPDLTCVSSLEPKGDHVFRADAPEAEGRFYRKCRNYVNAGTCNWMIPVNGDEEAFCVSCRLDTVIPDQTIPRNVYLWGLIEAAKRRLIYSALRLKLPLANRTDDPQRGLGFRFMADTVGPDGTPVRVMTAHDHGLITLNIEEADDSVREKMRLGLKEPYRTLLGHFRHETGHYYWDRLVLDSKFLEPYRALFGDERRDYDEALKAYYGSGAPTDWQDRYISMYSTMHPWEDWAETWAHYLHMMDTLETASAFGLRVGGPGKRVDIGDPYEEERFDRIVGNWFPLCFASNSLNRSMGHADFYPFILSGPVMEKLRFIHAVCETGGGRG